MALPGAESGPHEDALEDAHEDALDAIREDFSVIVTVAEQGIQALLEISAQLPIVGSVATLLKECWAAASKLQATQRSVERLMRNAASLVDHMLLAKASLPNLSEENVAELKTALAAVAKFLKQRATRGALMNVMTRKTDDKMITTLNFNLDVAKSNLNLNVSLTVASDMVTIKADVGRVEVGWCKLKPVL